MGFRMDKKGFVGDLVVGVVLWFAHNHLSPLCTLTPENITWLSSSADTFFFKLIKIKNIYLINNSYRESKLNKILKVFTYIYMELLLDNKKQGNLNYF